MVVDGAAGTGAEQDINSVAGRIHGTGDALDKLKLVGRIFLEEGSEVNHGLVVGQLARHNDSGHGNGPMEVSVWGDDNHVVVLFLEDNIAHGLADQRRGSNANAQDDNGFGHFGICFFVFLC